MNELTTTNSAVMAPAEARLPSRIEVPEDIAIEFVGGTYPAVPTEPDHLCREVLANIMLYGQDDEDTEIGSLHLYDARLDLAYFDFGFSPFDVLDAKSLATAAYLELLGGEDGLQWSEGVRKQFEPIGGDLLILDRMTIAEHCRGLGIGLVAASHAMDILGNHDGLVAAKPFPLQFEGYHDPDWKAPEGMADKDAAFTDAKGKLEKYWSRLGLKPVRGSSSGLWALSLAWRRPSVAEMLRKLKGSHRPRRTPKRLKRGG
jgi:hypothetical protein